MERVKKFKKIYLSLFFLFFLIGPATAVNKSLHVFQHMGIGTINWTTNTIYATGMHSFDNHSDQRISLRANAIEQAKQKARAALLATLMQVYIDSGTDLRTLLLNKPALISIIQNQLMLHTKPSMLPYTNKGNRICTQVQLKLQGSQGLLQLLLPFYPHLRIIPKPTGIIKSATHYTGVVLDLRRFKKFRPSLGTKIFDEADNLLYDPSFTDRTRFVRNGHIFFLNKFNIRAISKRAGNRFLLTLPKAIKGTVGSDIILFNKDAKRMLASAITRKNIRYCRVVILCNPISGK